MPISYNIVGHDLQFVEIGLKPYETVIAEAGTMMYMEDGINYDTKMGDGSAVGQDLLGKLLSGALRLITGESLFLTHFTNRAISQRHVSFAGPYPGTIIPINLQHNGGEVIVQRNGFLCAEHGTKISVFFNRKLGAGLFGGEGFILQKLSGSGMAFIHAGGTVVERTLNNEVIRVDTGCVVGFQPGITFDVERAGSLKSMIFGGEGIFLATLRGTGKVWLQSLPVRKLIQNLSQGGTNARKESGGLLGSLFER